MTDTAETLDGHGVSTSGRVWQTDPQLLVSVSSEFTENSLRALASRFFLFFIFFILNPLGTIKL